ncbi:hypothetical protein GMB86_14375 [Terrilactibacillus sp. BCM23-1]|uniref:Uncharacterized protein n=1 Tax=Terrilactibacillus tamarindi TaxID=2599694 RepID=A0A6N8CT03_9BACI|nr:hypothetical protein [Terrilactibacillus tamarindi]MTT33181.1 hypothetical protein [Terrilactibacillus tamarindi]
MTKKPFVYIIIFILSISVAVSLYLIHNSSKNMRTIMYFPMDRTILYKQVETSLTIQPVEDKSQLELLIRSQTNKPVSFRQDISLLYRNDRLINVLNRYKRNISSIKQIAYEPIIQGKYVAISFHHAENRQNHDIYGRDVMSHDYLSLMPLNNYFISFRKPDTPSEKVFQDALNTTLNRERLKMITKAEDKYKINPSSYYIIPFTQLVNYQSVPFPGLSKEKTYKVISQLWEGLYKNVFNGIKISEHHIEKSTGSRMPIVLLSKQSTHLYVLLETAKKQLVILKQQIH